MFELKPISSAGVPRAIAKAERYRLLNEPEEAESICLDILRVDADNQEVLVMLLLGGQALEQRFGGEVRPAGRAGDLHHGHPGLHDLLE